MLFSKNKSLRIWFFVNIGLVISHLLAIWTLYIFVFGYKKFPIDIFAIFWAIGASVIVLIYLFKLIVIIYGFYSLLNRNFLMISDYHQWYFLNQFLVKSSLVLFLFTFFYALSNIKVSFETVILFGQDYFIYLNFMPIIIFNGFIVWYNYKYKKIIKIYQKETNNNKISLVR